MLILDPPTAELGAIYKGRVVNVTKFGAFVNILPGRDGLVHISKLGRGKRIDRVEDVVNLGDELEVRVDDIDQTGKLSLSLVGAGRAVVVEAAADHVADDPIMSVDRSELASGLRVVTESLPQLRSVTLGAWVGTGARDEVDDIAGASHFLEHLLFKGTASRSAR